MVIGTRDRDLKAFVKPRSGRSGMAGRRGTQHATNILHALEEAPRPLSAYDLLDRLRPTGVAAPLTIYRALDKLIEAGKVHRIESLNAFVACRNGEHHHEQAGPAQPRTVGFTICDRCGTADEFVDETVFARLDGGLAAKGFVPRTSAIEVHGLCARCAATAELPPH
jgi:Fur family transcriptional regulator, zinc uptake regulator